MQVGGKKGLAKESRIVLLNVCFLIRVMIMVIKWLTRIPKKRPGY